MMFKSFLIKSAKFFDYRIFLNLVNEDFRYPNKSQIIELL